MSDQVKKIQDVMISAANAVKVGRWEVKGDGAKISVSGKRLPLSIFVDQQGRVALVTTGISAVCNIDDANAAQRIADAVRNEIAKG